VGWSLASHVMVQGSSRDARDAEEFRGVLADLKSEVKGLPRRVWGWRMLPGQLAGRFAAWRSRKGGTA